MYSVKVKDYPKELLEGRINTEGSLIGCLLQDMLLLDDYELNSDDFTTKDGMFYFSLMKNLRKKNINKITEMDIMTNFNEKTIERFKRMGGMASLETLMKTTNTSNIDAYLDELQRYNLYLELHNLKYPLLEEIKIAGEERVPIEFFKEEHFTAEEVLSFYETQMSKIPMKNINRGIEEIEMDLDDEFIEGCIEGEEMGTPIDEAGQDVDGKAIHGLSMLSEKMMGLLPGTLSFLGGYSSVGKSTMLISIIMALIFRGEKVLIVSNEQKSKPFKANFLLWILTHKLKYFKITKSKLIAGDLSLDDIAMIKKAQDIWRKEYKGKIYFISMPNADMNLMKKKIREYHLTKGVSCYLYDTFKLEFGDGNSQHWLKMIQDSRTLYELARKYDMIGIGTMQLAMSTLGTLFLTPNVLSQSKQVVEVLENLMLMRNVFPDELDPENKLYCKPYKRVKRNGKWINEDVELSRTMSYRMLFLSKCRNGENSESGNYAMLLAFDGKYGKVSEYCLCTPKHGIMNGFRK